MKPLPPSTVRPGDADHAAHHNLLRAAVSELQTLYDAIDASLIPGTVTVGPVARAAASAVDDLNLDPSDGSLTKWDGSAWVEVYSFGLTAHTHVFDDVAGLSDRLEADLRKAYEYADAIGSLLESRNFPYVASAADLPDDAPVGSGFVVGPERVLWVVPGSDPQQFGAPEPAVVPMSKDAITASDVQRMIADSDASVDEKIEALKAMVDGLKMSQFALQSYVLHGDAKQAYNDWSALPVNGTPYGISPPQFRVRHGFLEVRGTVGIGKTTGNVSVASLPADCPKPVIEQSFAVACRETGVQGRSGYVTVGTGGNFNFQTANANAVNEISFNGIRVEVKNA